MREYGQVQCSFWTDPDIQSLSPDAQRLALYLLTGPHSNGLGCYRLPDGYLQADLGWPSETVSKGFAELSRIGFAERCETSFFVLIPKYLRWNDIANGNVAKARMNEFEAVPKKARIFKSLCESMLKFGNHWPNGFETVLEGFIERYGKQDPTRPDPTLTDPNLLAPSSETLKLEPLKLNGYEPPPAVVERIPLVGNAEFPVTKQMVEEFDRAYPAVDVPQTLKEIRAWCIANPQHRKTQTGALRFINNWLSREQNKPAPAQQARR